MKKKILQLGGFSNHSLEGYSRQNLVILMESVIGHILYVPTLVTAVAVGIMFSASPSVYESFSRLIYALFM